jgi:hypothetical protein
MLISNIECGRCGAGYERAESTTLAQPEKADSYHCVVCNTPLEARPPTNLVAYRLTLPPDPPVTMR